MTAEQTVPDIEGFRPAPASVLELVPALPRDEVALRSIGGDVLKKARKPEPPRYGVRGQLHELIIIKRERQGRIDEITEGILGFDAEQLQNRSVILLDHFKGK